MTMADTNFDYVVNPGLYCQACGRTLGMIQSESGLCEMQLLKVGELLEQSTGSSATFHSVCAKCGEWNEFTATLTIQRQRNRVHNKD